MEFTRSFELLNEAEKLLPGGVNSPVRAFRAVEGTPPFIVRAEGCRLTDADGNEFIDYVGSWGPMLFGHARTEVVRAVQEAAADGLSFGAPTAREVALARRITRMIPSVEMVRLVNSGTEATMSAIRLARGFTGRAKVVKFEGCYHGHVDALLARAGSGAATFGTPDSAGVPPGTVADTVCLPYNDAGAFRKVCDSLGEDLACVIVEPVAGNMGCVPPDAGFLETLREMTEDVGALLIFDEVMTGFRLAPGGAQELFGIRPDLTALGKVLGGGLPLAAYGGRADIMRQVAPEGPVYQAGTLSGNPLATAAGLAQLELCTPEAYEYLEELSTRLATGLQEAAEYTGISARVQRVGSMLTLFFTDRPVRNFQDALSCDRRAFARFHRLMLERCIYLPPSQFEAWFVSTAHDRAAVDQTVEAAAASLRDLAVEAG